MLSILATFDPAHGWHESIPGLADEGDIVSITGAAGLGMEDQVCMAGTLTPETNGRMVMLQPHTLLSLFFNV